MRRMSRFHYHSVCFAGESGRMRSGVVTLNTRQVTRPALEHLRATLDFDENAVLVAMSYLGHMTQEEYETGRVRPPSVLLQAFWLTVAATALYCGFLLAG
ncbi:hypothetical protein JJB79_16235 [Pantoea eucrina]|uniref:Uncharacterized protein n=1 Tax=Pantoea eucrina TaxID=472693 RepID=A0ABS1Z982_9GAMM|nr:hypothetical protein [Pantoea eucrina]MBM0748942.1 hypothetical protein [Pantoea eucrina]QNH53376.1 hypothetical protein HWI77_19425 [Acinetobacter venetianus]